ncbi:MAG: ATP-binding protein [Desulfamplus sp.]|nr:ATP-binding protein [Desulfamplus sp.]
MSCDLTFGDFIELEEGEIKGRLALNFYSDVLNIDELWENSSLSANFLSTFWGNFFPKKDLKSGRTRKELQEEIRYICGELLGNAVKFSYEPDCMAEICLYLHEQELRFYVKNSVNPDNIQELQNLINKILTEDTNELFLEQMEKNADSGDESGVGLLTLINDYGVTLAWKFHTNESGFHMVTTLARLPITWDKNR